MKDLFVSRVSSILVANAPLRMGGEAKSIPVKNLRLPTPFEEKLCISNTFPLDQFHFEESVTPIFNSENLKRQTEKLLTQPRNDLVLCNMGELGYGVFAISPIPMGTVLCIYAGELLTRRQDYSDVFSDDEMSFYGSKLVVTGGRWRGIANYMQHLPSIPPIPDLKTAVAVLKLCNISEEDLLLNTELFTLQFENSNLHKKLATENVSREYLIYKGYPLIVMVSKEDIEAGEQLGIDYGASYWKRLNIYPEYFDRDGRIISHDQYKRTYGSLNFSDFSYCGPFAPLIHLCRSPEPSVTIMSDDKKPHSVTTHLLQENLLKAVAMHPKDLKKETTTWPLLTAKNWPLTLQSSSLLNELKMPTMKQPPALPLFINVHIIGEKKALLKICKINKQENCLQFLAFCTFLGSPLFSSLNKDNKSKVNKRKKKSQEPHYEFNANIFKQVYEVNPDAINELAPVLEMTSQELFKLARIGK